MMPAFFHLAAFLSAFLLFAVQPLMAKALLPALGGSAVVWGTCMVSFQGLLFLGYLGSHLALARWRARTYLWVHVLGLGVVALVTPVFGVIADLVPGPPWWAALVATLGRVGPAFFLLSFSTPLLQRWLAEARRGHDGEEIDSYRLFSSSNLGSLSALLAYPWLIEPHLSLSAQSQWWRGGLIALTVLLFTMVLIVPRRKRNTLGKVKQCGALPYAFKGRVFALSAAGCALLLAVTNAVTFDLSSAPLLWVGPLALYLLSFVVVYKRRPWWNERIAEKGRTWWLGVGLTLFLMGRFHLGFSATATTLMQWAVMAFGCWLAHGRLATLKPRDERALTGYYVAMSAGGVVGSMLVSWVVPVVADTFIEYPLAMAALVAAARRPPLGMEAKAEKAAGPGILAWSAPWKEGLGGLMVTALLLLAAASVAGRFGTPVLGFSAMAGLLLLLSLARPQALWLAAVAASVSLVAMPVKDALWQTPGSRHYRNHYGIYEIAERGNRRYLTHGTTNHGIQDFGEAMRGEALSYYHREGPAGALLVSLEPRPRRFGMIGLGAGALAVYARPGDVLEVFELDPLNIRLAREAFTYLSDREAAGVVIEIRQGDGRRRLQGMVGRFDVLILDAFSSGAIPMHLLTVEAVATYLESVKLDGFVLLHISNRALRLRPMVASLGRALGHEVYFKDSQESIEDEDLKSSDWALLGPSDEQMRALARRTGWLSWDECGDSETLPLPRPWTDETSDLLAVWDW